MEGKTRASRKIGRRTVRDGPVQGNKLSRNVFTIDRGAEAEHEVVPDAGVDEGDPSRRGRTDSARAGRRAWAPAR